MGYNEFYGNINSSSEKVKNLINEKKDILIVSNCSCDGIISASILIRAIWKLGGKATARLLNRITREGFVDLKNEDHEFYLFTDLGTGQSDFFNKLFSNKWIMLDHKKISFAEIATDDDNNILNPREYDINGEKEISSGGISYLLAKNLDKGFTDLSPLAIVSALGEYQDLGDRRSLIGLNNEILEDSKRNGLIQTDIDLLLSNKESLPIHEAVANTFIPYLYGLTSNSVNCLELLKKTNIDLKIDGRWKTIDDINQEEKFIIIESIGNYLSSKINNKIENLENILIGYTYLLSGEEYGTDLYDARRFSELLYSCALGMKSGLGMSICLGERSEFLGEAEKDEQEFKDSCHKLISKILKEKWRISDKGLSVFINADGIMEPDYVDYLSRLLTSHYQFLNKSIIMKIAIDENYLKYFLNFGFNIGIDADLVTKELSSAIDGITVTFNKNEGEIIIPSSQDDVFMSIIMKFFKKISAC